MNNEIVVIQKGKVVGDMLLPASRTLTACMILSIRYFTYHLQNRSMRMKLKLFVTLAFLLSAPLTVLGQMGTIEGKVTDANGVALPGANVNVQGTSLGAAADRNGDFTISDVPAGTYTVEAGFIGYESGTQEVTVSSGQTATANFQLAEDVLMMGEIVVTGTRGRTRTVLESPVPIDAFDVREVERQGNGD
ncbi:MAG: carboxypeptidase-like regulatory domain-containing protein, partial [bacterium]